MDNDYLHGDIPEAHGQKASISLDMNQSAGGSWAANTSTPENLSFDTSNTHEYVFERFNEGQTDQISHLKKKNCHNEFHFCMYFQTKRFTSMYIGNIGVWNHKNINLRKKLH